MYFLLARVCANSGHRPAAGLFCSHWTTYAGFHGTTLPPPPSFLRDDYDKTFRIKAVVTLNPLVAPALARSRRPVATRVAP